MKKLMILCVCLLSVLTCLMPLHAASSTKDLKKVTNVEVEYQDYKTVELTWKKQKNADVYHVYVKSYKKDSKFVKKLSVTKPKAVLSGLMTGKKYSCYVVAENENGKSKESEIVDLWPSLNSEDFKLEIETISKTRCKISWNQVDGATRYIVYRKRGNDQFAKVLTLKGDVFSYTTSKFPHGSYSFIVKAARYDGQDRTMSSASNTVRFDATTDIPKVEYVVKGNSVKLSWKEIEGMSHYVVYRSTSKTGKYDQLKVTKATSYTDKSLKSGNTYYFKVRAYKKYNGEKIYSHYSSIKKIAI